MDDNIGDKLTKILQDPEGLKLITQLASGFLNNNSKTDSEKMSSEDKDVHDTQSEAAFSAVKAVAPAPSFENLMNKSREAERINLLKSLRPFLDDHRKGRVDGIVKALGAAELFSKYKGEDILKTFGLK